MDLHKHPLTEDEIREVMERRMDQTQNDKISKADIKSMVQDMLSNQGQTLTNRNLKTLGEYTKPFKIKKPRSKKKITYTVYAYLTICRDLNTNEVVVFIKDMTYNR